MFDGNASNPERQNDPFGGEEELLPYEEVLKATGKEQWQSNRDALRHIFEEVAWETFDQPELRRFVIWLVWYGCPYIDPSWIAEAFCMTVRNVCEVAESEAPFGFPCLQCGVERLDRSRKAWFTMQESLRAYWDGEEADPPRALLCRACIKLREERETQQRQLDQKRYSAIIRDHRQIPYEDRRATGEWDIIRRQVLLRDGYRCRVCNRHKSEVPLHVHHRTYKRYAQESLEDLITLCARCHGLFHQFGQVS